MVNTPVFLTSVVATSAMLPRSFEHTLFLSSHAVASLTDATLAHCACSSCFLHGGHGEDECGLN